MTMKNNDVIKVLSDRQQAREKLPIFYGSRDNYVHGLKEVIANATDELINHFKRGSIHVTLHDDLQTITVKDTGRGIPLDGETEGIKNYDLLFKTLFAGTKYDNESDKAQTGVNGVGTTVLNYTSILFEVTSVYAGNCFTVRFKNGGEFVDFTKAAAAAEAHGTTFKFILDKEVYTDTVYNSEIVRDIVKRFAVSSSKVYLTYIHGDKEEKFHYANLREYFDEIIGKNTTSFVLESNDIEIYDNDEKNVISICLTTTPEVIQESYLNLTYLSEGGAFNNGVLNGLRAFFNKYAKANNLFPKGVKNFTLDDMANSFSFVITDLSNEVEFSNQTKLSTSKDIYQKVTEKHIQQLLKYVESENPEGLKKMCKHVLEIQKHNEKSDKAIKALKKKLTEKVEGIGNKVDDLVDCKKHGEEAELYIAEGQSALGSIVLARNADFQAAYALRGKILNCLKANYSEIFKSKIIMDLIKALGCGIEADNKNKNLESFDISKLRFGKVVIATDQDSDGFQIACLILTMFYRLVPTILKEGRVYIARTPLYEIRLSNDEMIYFYSETEKDQELPKIKDNYSIARVKGLGELEPETMSETAMNANTRVLTQVIVEDVEAMEREFKIWLDDDVTGRKEVISKHLADFLEVVQ